MPTPSVTQHIKPHWLMRLFGADSAILRLTPAGLQVETRRGAVYVLPAESLMDHAAIQEGAFFYRLVLHTNRGRKVFGGLPKWEARNLLGWLRSCWLTHLAPDIDQAARQIEDLLGSGYPRQSRINAAMAAATQNLSRFHAVPDPDEYSQIIDLSPFFLVARVAQWTAKDIEQLRQRYIQKQLTAYADFFDQVESKPLTERQREACVVDEHNNLVLAGAGTGKTSTMVGRAGYLVRSGQVAAGEVLMLAFAKKAAEEMQERIDARLGIRGITASTFHKLGKEIIAAVEGQQPSVTPLAEDEKLLARQVNNWFELHLQMPEYQRLALEYFQYHLYPAANPFDFKTEGEYFDYILANDIRTLKGEAVKSLGECLVANHLFRQGVEYQYEPAYQYRTASPLHRQYHPDFYLPQYGIYVEYFGIDHNGDTAPFVDREKYYQGMTWKRQLHANHGTQLMELFHYEMQDGSLFESVNRQLTALGVVYQPLPSETVLNTLREFGAVSHFASLLADLLKRYRANCYEEGQVETAIHQAKNPAQVAAALELLMPILADYQALLDQQQCIDFDDMIGKAIRYVKTGRFKSPWRTILVDEFQDISDARARLVKYLRDAVPECSLFCVGDDWQAIYRFTGSDLNFTTEFEQQFGATRITALDLTFRFNDNIGDTATRFVLQNPAQMKKQLNSLRQVKKPAISILRADNRKELDLGQPSRIEQVLARIVRIAEPGSSVYLLGRYGFNLPEPHELKQLARQFPQLRLECHTLHASKGKEADYVVVLGLETGKHGFPSYKVTHPLLEALLPTLEPYPHAEERRLFYVALTRARYRVYLVTDMAVVSDFVVELLQNDYKVELKEFETSLTQELFHLIKCLKCKTGTLVPRQGKFGSFFGCSKFPLCNHMERGCQACGMPMHRTGRFKVCINPDCKTWAPVCPDCGAEMVKRQGRYGEFWGCRNYRSEGESCRHTEQEIMFNG